jgi:hypothetical protein
MSDTASGREPALSFVERVVAALRLQPSVYAEVSADRRANVQAFAVVLLAGIFNGFGLGPKLGGAALPTGVIAAVLGWFTWTAVVLGVALLFGAERRPGPLLRAVGFANAPGFFLLAGGLPGVGAVVRIAVVAWLVAASVVAVEAVFRVERRRAVVICLCGLLAYMLLGSVLAELSPAG